jgi:hypothetical protein
MDDPLAVKFTHSNTVHERRPYTIYEIEVRSSSTITWVIYKRYSSFDSLAEQLQKFAQSNLAILGPIKLPVLPPKRMTRSLAAEFVEKRRIELQDYLRSCLHLSPILHSDIMLNFLEVPDSVRPMLSRPNPSKTATGQDGGKSSEKTQDKASSTPGGLTPDEKQVIDLISALRSSSNKAAAIRAFELWFFQSQSLTHRSRLSTEYIRLLLEGQIDTTIPSTPSVSQNQSSLRPNVHNTTPAANVSVGLVYAAGDFRHSRCAARAALCLIARLCDPERNKDSQLYTEQFASLPMSLLQKLRLQNHIFTTRGNRPAAFQIIYAIQQFVEARSPSASNTTPGAPSNDITLESLVQEQWARQEYLKWLRVKLSQHNRSLQASHEHTNTMSLFLRGNTLAAYRPLILSGFQQILELCSIEDGWQDIDLRSALSKPIRYDNVGNKANNGNNIISNQANTNFNSATTTTATTTTTPHNKLTQPSPSRSNNPNNNPQTSSNGGGNNKRNFKKVFFRNGAIRTNASRHGGTIRFNSLHNPDRVVANIVSNKVIPLSSVPQGGHNGVYVLNSLPSPQLGYQAGGTGPNNAFNKAVKKRYIPTSQTTTTKPGQTGNLNSLRISRPVPQRGTISVPPRPLGLLTPTSASHSIFSPPTPPPVPPSPSSYSITRAAPPPPISLQAPNQAPVRPSSRPGGRTNVQNTPPILPPRPEELQIKHNSLPVSLSYQCDLRDSENNLVLVRSCVLLPFSVSEVTAILSVPELIPLWDTKVSSATVTHQFDQSADIFHLVYFTKGSIYKKQDFSLLRSITQLQDGTIVILYRSVNIFSCAEVKGYQRCVLAPSGYLISPISQTETLVTLILQLDPDSVLLYASDLLGESHEVKSSWENLVTLLEENR